MTACFNKYLKVSAASRYRRFQSSFPKSISASGQGIRGSGTKGVAGLNSLSQLGHQRPGHLGRKMLPAHPPSQLVLEVLFVDVGDAPRGSTFMNKREASIGLIFIFIFLIIWAILSWWCLMRSTRSDRLRCDPARQHQFSLTKHPSRLF